MTLAAVESLWLLLPVGVILALIITVEIAVGVTVSSLPRSRFQQRWTLSERRRVTRVFFSVLCIWPTIVGVVVTNLFAPLSIALMIDVAAAALLAWGIVWVVKNGRRKRRILEGHCIECDYNLAGRLNAKACPECGVELEGHPGLARLRRVGGVSPRT